jgi:hypothetical protein
VRIFWSTENRVDFAGLMVADLSGARASG